MDWKFKSVQLVQIAIFAGVSSNLKKIKYFNLIFWRNHLVILFKPNIFAKFERNSFELCLPLLFLPVFVVVVLLFSFILFLFFLRTHS